MGKRSATHQCTPPSETKPHPTDATHAPHATEMTTTTR